MSMIQNKGVRPDLLNLDTTLLVIIEYSGKF